MEFKMKILVLTSHFPASDLPKDLTPVVYYFTKEWVRTGHSVMVVHNQTVFPSIVYLFLKSFNKLLASIVGYNFPTFKPKEIDYEVDGVKVFRRSMMKLLPKKKFVENSYVSQQKVIDKILLDNDFMPDIVVAHWLTPQAALLQYLKEKYKVPTCLVVHENSPVLKRDYPEKWPVYVSNLDLVGYRSRPIKEAFIADHNISGVKDFFCYSGVPREFIPSKWEKSFTKNKTYTFVGTLIKRKHPAAILDALSAPENINSEWKLNYLGEGHLKKSLEKFSAKLGVNDKVFLRGRVPREEVNSVLMNTDVFVMISETEAFGLVYLEAMANGCITIASRNEGMDGVIKDGVNGFLCTAGDVEELKSIISKINSLSEQEIKEISYQAFLTASNLTDEKVALNYVQHLEKCVSK
ncbi:glycosyltransferase [Zobellia sp. B3R18]|uniref:glycosyltransferase n=1 Tax=Zobellia sp. B3R18 TaxID=2841568 RepID=UPI001C0712BF|nr:glycosyltransferase [Zobellia sp. B3R18]MBU2975500.1 glycosyltransferase [Zobellia sp. B3R18]